MIHVAFFSLAQPGVAPHNRRQTKKNKKKKKEQKNLRYAFVLGGTETRQHCLYFALGYSPPPFSAGCQILQRSLTDGLDFYQAFIPPSDIYFATVFRIKTDARDPKHGRNYTKTKHCPSAASDCPRLVSEPCSGFTPRLSQIPRAPPLQTETPKPRKPAASLVLSHLVGNLPRECDGGELLVITQI